MKRSSGFWLIFVGALLLMAVALFWRESADDRALEDAAADQMRLVPRKGK